MSSLAQLGPPKVADIASREAAWQPPRATEMMVVDSLRLIHPTLARALWDCHAKGSQYPEWGDIAREREGPNPPATGDLNRPGSGDWACEVAQKRFDLHFIV